MDKVEAWEREAGAGIRDDMRKQHERITVEVRMAFKKAKRKKLKRLLIEYAAKTITVLTLWALAIAVVFLVGCQIRVMVFAFMLGWGAI